MPVMPATTSRYRLPRSRRGYAASYTVAKDLQVCESRHKPRTDSLHTTVLIPTNRENHPQKA